VKINISRHQIYVMLFSIFLLAFVLIFAFVMLIPEGKEYRQKRIELKKVKKEFQQYQDFHEQTEVKLKDLQSKNRNTIAALQTLFNPSRFEKQHKKHFSSLKLSALSRVGDEDGFALYEVNTTSHINSPKNFYDFLDDVNRGDWLIGVNFPIDFHRDGEMIKSSFTMRVYANNLDKNSTASGSEAK
jgi:hypothetical protein